MTIKPSKIIRRCCIITQHEIKDVNAELHIINKIGYLIEEANDLAKKLNYPKNSVRYSILGLHYAGSNIERPINDTVIHNLNDLFTRMVSTGLNGQYTYVIDGEFDEYGRKLLDNSVKIKKMV